MTLISSRMRRALIFIAIAAVLARDIYMGLMLLAARDSAHLVALHIAGRVANGDVPTDAEVNARIVDGIRNSRMHGRIGIDGRALDPYGNRYEYGHAITGGRVISYCASPGMDKVLGTLDDVMMTVTRDIN